MEAAGVAGAGGVTLSAGHRSTDTHTTNAVATAATGTSHFAVTARHHGRASSAGVVFAIDASSAWHRAQLAACCSTSARACRDSDPSTHAASVSASA